MQLRSPLKFFTGSRREQFYPYAIALATYILVFLGSYVIGSTAYGIFVLGGALATVVGVTIVLRPQLGAYILIFFIFTNFSDVIEVSFGIPDTNKLLVAVILVAVLGRRVVIDNKPIVFRVQEMAVLAYGMWIATALLLGKDQTEMISIMIDWFKDFIILFILIQLSSDERIWKNSHWILIIAATFIGSLSVYQILSKNTANNFYGLANAPKHEIVTGYDDTRITGPLDDPNFYAMMMLMTFPMAAYLMLTSPKWYTKILSGFMALIIMLTVLFTYSRGAFIALVAVGSLIVLERKMNPYKIAGTLIVIILIFMPVMPKGFTSRLDTLSSIFPSSGKASNQAESSFRGRTSELLVAIMMFKDNPLHGVGRLNYPESYLEYSGRLGLDDRYEARQAHSMYFEVLAEEGLVGFGFFVAMLAAIVAGLLQARKIFIEVGREDLVPRPMACLFGLVGYLLPSIFLHMDWERYFWLILAFCCASSVQAQVQLDLYRYKRRAEVAS